MKKKTLAVGISMAVGVSLLLSTAFASAMSISPYEAYKEAAKNTIKHQSMTAVVEGKVTDNGKELVTVSSTAKADRTGNGSFSSVTTVKGNGTQVSMQNYGADGQLVMKVDGSDTYFVSKERMNDRRCGSERMMDPEEERVGNLFIDSVVGSLKDQFTSKDNGDGTSTISIQLENGQIPALANGLMSLAVRDASVHHNEMSKEKSEFMNMVPGAKNLEPEMPKLVQDVQIQKGTMTAIVSQDKTIQSQTANLTVTGKDANGVLHELNFQLQFSISDVNKTTPDKIDLTGKTVKVIEHKEVEER